MLSQKMKSRLVSFLEEDIGKGDVTSALLKKEKCKAKIIAKEAGLLAGLEEAEFLFNHLKVKAKAKANDGDKIRQGQVVLELNGVNRNVLMAERTVLNVLGRMSGIATACAQAQKIIGKDTFLALTRKTLPGFNLFDKKAASIARIWPHRLDLSAMVLLKENHLHFFRNPGEAVGKAKKAYGKSEVVEVEVQTLKEAVQAAEAGADMILLDNFSLPAARKAIAIIRKKSNAFIELSGGITLKNLKNFRPLKADLISMGELTHSVKAVDFSLIMVKGK